MSTEHSEWVSIISNYYFETCLAGKTGVVVPNNETTELQNDAHWNYGMMQDVLICIDMVFN